MSALIFFGDTPRKLGHIVGMFYEPPPTRRLGDKLLRVWAVCPQNGTAVLKWLTVVVVVVVVFVVISSPKGISVDFGRFRSWRDPKFSATKKNNMRPWFGRSIQNTYSNA